MEKIMKETTMKEYNDIIVINAGDLTIEEVIGLSNIYDVVLADGKICLYPKKEKAKIVHLVHRSTLIGIDLSQGNDFTAFAPLLNDPPKMVHRSTRSR